MKSSSFSKFCSRVLILFSRFVCIIRSLLAKFFEKEMENLRIPYFKNSHFEWSEKEGFSWRFDFTISIWFLNFLANSVLSSKQLLNFQTPDLRAKVSLLTKEQKTWEWSEDRPFRISVFYLIPVNCQKRKYNQVIVVEYHWNVFVGK